MDALRASTMFLLVPVHAAGMLASNGNPGDWAVAIFWCIHVFRLPLFFAMSGFFLTLLLRRQGLEETLRNRTTRIVAPLAIGLVTVVPLFFATAELTGVVIPGAGAIEGGAFRFEPAFLWFVWYLLILDGIAISLYLLAPGALASAGRGMRTLLSRPALGIPILAALTAATIWSLPDWTAVPQGSSFVPDLPTLAYNSIFFAFGATLCAHRPLISSARDNAWRWTVCAAVAVVPAALLFAFHEHPFAGQFGVHAAGLWVYAVATWASLFALVGLATRYLNTYRPRLRYLADSSYWIYLSHLPAMVLLVALVGTSSLAGSPLAARFVLVTTGALAFSLLTYPLLVRYTVIGRVLNGPRARPDTRLAPKPTPVVLSGSAGAAR